jgi:23S rRNA (adenine2503-C2)-methyltransferase
MHDPVRDESDPSAGGSPPAVRLEPPDASHANVRWGVRLGDGARVECVLYRGDTLCVSSQVGCAVRCPFCASGANGLGRSLTLDEMLGQVDAVRALGHGLARVTVSGVGEPLHNHRVVQEFVRACHARRVAPSLTTSGGPLPRLREWLHAPHNGVTISVHAGSEATRARMVPHGPALEPLFALLHEEAPRMTQRRRRKTALAYLAIAGENDADAEIDAFVARARGLGFRIHLYAYNPVAHSAYAPLPEERYQTIYRRMAGSGMRVAMSSRARVQPNGGCGTLVALHVKHGERAGIMRG